MNITEWNTHLSHLADFLEVFPLIPFLFLSREKKREYRLLAVYFLSGFILKAISFFLAREAINSLFLYHILAPLEFGLLFLFFTEHTTYRTWRSVILTVVIASNAIASAQPEALQQFSSLTWSINTLALVCACLYSFYELYNKSYRSWDEVRSRFIIISGFLIYLSGCLFTYILGSQILSKELQGFFANGWIINSISNLAKDLIVAAGLLAARKE